MAAKLPEAGQVALCVAIAKLPEAGQVALCVAIGCAAILDPLLSFLERAIVRGPVLGLDAPVLFIALTLPMAYLTGVVLLHPHVTAAAGTPPVVLAALRQYVLLVSGLLVLLSVVSLFPAAGGQ